MHVVAPQNNRFCCLSSLVSSLLRTFADDTFLLMKYWTDGVEQWRIFTEQMQNKFRSKFLPVCSAAGIFQQSASLGRADVNLQEQRIRGWCRRSRGSRPGPGSWWLACRWESGPLASWWTPCQSYKCHDGSAAGLEGDVGGRDRMTKIGGEWNEPDGKRREHSR